MEHNNSPKSNTAFLNLQAGKLLFLFVSMLLFSVGAFADTPEDPSSPPDENAPFDGGFSLLVAAGVAYGARKWHLAKQGQKQDEEDSENI